jgi:hypothetical protein
MATLTHSDVLAKLAELRRTFWTQDFTFTPDQAAQYNTLRKARWARVLEMTSAS